MELSPSSETSPKESAWKLLQVIEDFSPQEFAAHDDHEAAWLLIARIYLSAVALYCISTNHTLNGHSSRIGHRRSLFSDLKKGREMMQVKSAVLWPMVVAGFEADADGPLSQAFVEGQITEMSFDMGSSLPLTARDVLKRFWAKSGTGWEDCFDQPYAFIL
jgi:hypothetical protein